MSEKQRIIELQRSLRIAKMALERIAYGAAQPHDVADDALSEIFKLALKQPLQGLVGHGGRRP